MKDEKTVLFPVYRMVVPAVFENWLEKMASDGWHINHIGQWSSILMTLKCGTPKKYRFVYDLQASPRKDYKTTYEQFGWEYLGRMSSVYIWRKEYKNERPEAFSDNESIIKRTRRTVAAISFSFISLIIALVAQFIFFFISKPLTSSKLVQLGFGITICSIFIILLGLVMLKKKRNEDR
jgi:hypothetical protein